MKKLHWEIVQLIVTHSLEIFTKFARFEESWEPGWEPGGRDGNKKNQSKRQGVLHSHDLKARGGVLCKSLTSTMLFSRFRKCNCLLGALRDTGPGTSFGMIYKDIVSLNLSLARRGFQMVWFHFIRFVEMPIWKFDLFTAEDMRSQNKMPQLGFWRHCDQIGWWDFTIIPSW